MNAITLHCEWLPAIVYAATDPEWKRIENRVWPPPRSIIDKPFVLHGGVSKPTRARREAVLETVDVLMGGAAAREYENVLEVYRGRVGCVVRVNGWLAFGGFATLHVKFAKGQQYTTSADEGLERWHFAGQFGWVLETICPIVPVIECKGALGIWQLPPDVERQVSEALR